MIDLIYQLLKEFHLNTTLAEYLSPFIAIGFIAVLCVIANFISKKIILNIVHRAVEKSRNKWDDIFLAKKIFDHLSQIAPAFLIYLFATEFSGYQSWIQRLSLTYMIIVGIIVIDRILDAVVDIYRSFEISRQHPIKGYIQIAKIFLFIIGGILVVSTIIQKSPWLLLSGMGAIMALILIVFKDTLLGLVASVQLSGNDMVRIGDWIEVPQYGGDGEVLDITLHTVKIQNWDKTITTVPSYALVSESFKNWRGMQESGGRRIKRVVYIDMTSIKFCTEEMLDRFERIQLITDYIIHKREEVEQYNREHNIDTSNIVNGRRLTNIGTFRAYLQAYLKNHPRINKEMSMLVRHLAPTENGLPIEVYVFANDCAWVNYESIQADIFDHIFSILPAFELRVFQTPTGHDLKEMLHQRAHMDQNDQRGLL